MARKRCALITGGAMGIGRAVAEDLLSKGWKVCLADIQDKAGTKAVAELGPDTKYIHCDVRDYDQLVNMFKEAVDFGGRVDFYGSNAGTMNFEAMYLPIKDGQPNVAPDLALLDVHLKAAIYGLQAYRFSLHETMGAEGAKPGVIVFTASLGGLYKHWMGPVYSACKHGVVGLTRSSATRLPSSEIRVNVVCPGPTMTPGAGPKFMGTVPDNCMTEYPTLAKAFWTLIDSDQNGKVLAVSHDDISYVEQPSYATPTVEWVTEDMGVSGARVLQEMLSKGPPPPK